METGAGVGAESGGNHGVGRRCSGEVTGGRLELEEGAGGQARSSGKVPWGQMVGVLASWGAEVKSTATAGT